MAFTGKAIYDTGVMSNVAEDVSDIISMISPFETPLLAALGDSQYPARNVYHEWLEDSLGPTTIVASTNVASDATGPSTIFIGTNAKYLQVGAILRGPEATGAEYFQILAVGVSTISVSRAFGGTTANSFAAGQSLSIITDVALDGADVSTDTSKARTRTGNYTMIVKKDVWISGTVRAVSMLGGINDEWDYQIMKKTKEVLRDLEKAVILSRSSGNSIGSASAYRTMAGMLSLITTNVDSWGTLTAANLTSSIKKAWDNGGTDCNLIVCGDSIKNTIDSFNNTRIQAVQGTGSEGVYTEQVSVFECTYGSLPVMLDRWMPSNRFAIISTDRVKPVPLQGRSFQFEEVAKTGDSTKGYILGEYTLELRNQEGMVQGKV